MIVLYLLLLSLPFILFRPKDIFQPEFLINIYYVIFIALGPIALLAVAPQTFATGRFAEVTQLVMLGYLCLNIGFLLANIRRRDQYAPDVFSPDLVPKSTFALQKARRYKWTIRGMLVLSFLALALFFARAGSIPILATNKEAARVEALSVGGNGYLLYIATLGMSAVLLYSCQWYRNNSPRRLRHELPVIFFAFFVGLCLMGTGSRRYFFWSMIYVFIARNYFYKKVKVGYAVLLGSIAFLGVNVFEMFRNSASDTTTDILTTSYYRLIVYFYNLEATFSAFRSIDFMWGSTFFMDIITILPGKQIDYQSWVKEITGLEFEGFGVPPTIVGDMYINFGVPGIIMGCILLGFAIKWFYKQKTRGGVSILGLFSYGLILEISIRTLTSGLSAQSMGLLWVLAVITSVWSSNYFFSGRLKSQVRRLKFN